jgi:hypothetical protein
MTLVSQIITDAYRQSNILAIGDLPTDDQNTEGLTYINRVVKSVFGNEVGDPLMAFPIGGAGISRPAGYPWYGTVPDADWFVPKNTRLMFNLTQPVDIYLHPDPDAGTRFAVSDVTGNFSTYPVTVHGNGRLIEGAQSITLNTDDLKREWFYRDDTATWERYSPLEAADTFPFPEEFDDFFITMLAIRLNPSYGVQLDAQSEAIFKRSRSQLRTRYTQDVPMRSEIALIRLSRMTAERDLYGTEDYFYDPTAMFDKGWPY